MSFSGLPMCGLLPVNRARALVECRLETVSHEGWGAEWGGPTQLPMSPFLTGTQH